METLTLTLFGQSRVLCNGRELNFRTRKDQALLFYLVGEPGAHRREQLWELLWPGLPEGSARKLLRQTIYTLRRTLPDKTTAKEGRRPCPSSSLTGRPSS